MVITAIRLESRNHSVVPITLIVGFIGFLTDVAANFMAKHKKRTDPYPSERFDSIMNLCAIVVVGSLVLLAILLVYSFLARQ